VAVERDTPEHRRFRRKFCAYITALNADRLVFIDESYCKTGMCREHGWSQRGFRAKGTRPYRCWKTVSLVGAIRLGERPRLMTHRGTVDGKVFIKFVKRYLVPSLRRGDVVVMDNLNFHKMKAVRALIEAAGATPMYLPTYSPELNPIELWWADMKRHLRKLAVNVEVELRQAARRLRSALPLSKVAGWFRKALREAQVK
jgi:transposase